MLSTSPTATSSRPPEPIVSRAPFWDGLAEKYFAQPIADPGAYEETLAAIRSHLEPHHQALEVGAGTGGTAVRLAPSVAQWTATDVSPEMLRFAAQRLAVPGAADNVALEVAEASAPLPGGPYDVICALNLLHLVPDLDVAVARLREAVVPGGVVISKTPCLAERGFWLQPLIPILRFFGRAPEVVRFFRTADLEEAFRRAGFAIEESRTFGEARTSRYLVARRPPASSET
jgi:SAM-dependent methyltransferase